MNLDEKKPALRRSDAVTIARAATKTAIARPAPGHHAGHATGAAGHPNAVARKEPIVTAVANGRMVHRRLAMRATDAVDPRRHMPPRVTRVLAVIVLRLAATVMKRTAAIVRLVRRAISAVAVAVRLTVKRPAMAAARPRRTSAEAWATVARLRRDTLPTAVTAITNMGERITMGTVDRRRATTGGATITVVMASMPALRSTAADRVATRRAITAIVRPIMAIGVRHRRVRMNDPTANTTAVRLLRRVTATRIKSGRTDEAFPP